MHQITMTEVSPTGDAIGATTIVRVAEGQVRDFRVIANGAGVGELPKVDFVAIVQALGTPASQSAPALATPPRADRSKAAAAPSEAAKRTRQAKVVTTAMGDRPKRQYLRAPGIDDFVKVYEECAGSQAGIAAHYNVPEHTVNGWLRTHRKNHPERLAPRR